MNEPITLVLVLFNDEISNIRDNFYVLCIDILSMRRNDLKAGLGAMDSRLYFAANK